MDMGFDQNGWQNGWRHILPSDPSEHGLAPSLDWYGLRARLAAAYLYRRTHAAAGTEAAATGGSFDSAAARALVAYGNGQRSVNPTALGDGKGRAGIHTDAAGAPEPGDRG